MSGYQIPPKFSGILSAMSNSPVKHHFSPAFSNKPWAIADRQLCEMKLVNGVVVSRRTHPNATGYRKNLYRTDGVGPEHEQHLEVKFMKPLDTAADRALRKILSGDRTPWDGELRSEWTRYILSLMFRNPEVVWALKGHIKEMWDVGIKALENNYAERRRPDDPATFEEYFARTNPAAAEIGATNMIATIIDNDRVGPSIFNMHWSRVPLTRSNVSLLNSDRPIDRPLGLGDSRAYIAIPISPDTLFLASNDATLAGRIASGDHTKAAKMMNKTVVSQACEFVWGVDDSQLAFVQKHMGSAPRKPIIDDKQRAEAIAVACGLPPTSTGGR